MFLTESINVLIFSFGADLTELSESSELTSSMPWEVRLFFNETCPSLDCCFIVGVGKEHSETYTNSQCVRTRKIFKTQAHAQRKTAEELRESFLWEVSRGYRSSWIRSKCFERSCCMGKGRIWIPTTL